MGPNSYRISIREAFTTNAIPPSTLVLVLVLVVVLEDLGVGLVTSRMRSPQLLPRLFHTLGITHAFEDEDEDDDENEYDLAPVTRRLSPFTFHLSPNPTLPYRPQEERPEAAQQRP